MGKDLEKFEPSADLTPMYGPGAYTQNASYSADFPEWWDDEPPYGATDSLKHQIERGWSYVMRWPRKAFKGAYIAFMWTTYSPWRFLVVAGTIALIVGALISGFRTAR